MKRKFSLLVAVACLFSSLTFGSIAHAATETAFTDVTSATPNSEAILTLSKLGVINGYANDDNTTYSFKPQGDITRGEFAKIITVALGAQDEVATSSIEFSDIEGHWAKPYVLVAASRGIVNGFEDGTFKPDENVTYEQAVKMIVCAAGYESIAQSLGGWPNGYMMQAMNLKLTDNAVTADQTGKASRGIVAQLMFNVLDVDIPVYNSITGKLEDNLKTFMETYMGIVMVDAQLVGVEEKTVANYVGPTLYVGEMGIKLKNGSVMVLDYTPYTQDKATLEAYVGQDAVVYYKEGKSGNMSTLYEIDFDVAKNTVVTVNSNDIESFSGSTLKYYTSGTKTKTLKLASSDLSVYYNGKLALDPTDISDWLDPADTANFIYGEVKLTDRGSDGEFDTVEITDYDFLVVARTPSTTDYLVTNKVKFTSTPPAKHLAQIALDPDDITYTVNIQNDKGAAVNVTSLAANNVLLVAQSEHADGQEAEIKNVVVCGSPVTGKITAASASEGTVTIQGKEYRISDYAAQYFTENSIKTETGQQGTFYVDKWGTIIFGTQTAVSETTNPYAYIIRTSLNEDEDGGTITAYVPSQSGVKNYTVTGKVRYNGSPIAAADAIEALRNNVPTTTSNAAVPDMSDSGVYGTGNSPILTNSCQVARLVLDGTTVEEIVVAAPADYPANYGTTEDTSNIKPYQDLDKVRYRGSSNFNGEFFVNSSTTFIYVPQDRSKTSSYAKRSTSSFHSGSEYYVQPYNVNSSKVADLVLVYGKETETIVVKNTTQASIMAKDYSTVIKNDEQVYEIEYYTNSATASKSNASISENVNVSNSEAGYTIVDIADIKAGDIFRAGTDSDLGLVNAQVLIEIDDVMAAIAGNSDFTDDSKFYKKFAGGEYGFVFVANVDEVLDDNGTYSIVAYRGGFTDGELDTTSEQMYIPVNSSTVIYRINSEGEVTPYVDEGTTRITPLELREAKYDGESASKIGVYSYSTDVNNRQVKMILIYE